MRASVLSAVAAACLAAAPASAHPAFHYTGECEATLKYDPTTGDYTGEARVAVVATAASTGLPAPTTPISVRCVFRAEGHSNEVVVEWAGVGAAAAANPVSMHVEPADQWFVCDDVTVGGEHHPGFCRPVKLLA